MQLLNDLFVNLCILGIVFITFNVSTKKRKGFISATSNIYRRIHFGVNMGGIGVVLMCFSINVGNFILDLRQIPIVIAAIYGGLLPPIIAAFIIAAGRIILFPIGQTTIVALVLSIFTGILCGVVSKIRLDVKKKILVMILSHLILLSAIFCVSIPYSLMPIHIYAGYWSISFMAGFVIYYLMEYLRQSKEHLENTQENIEIDLLLQTSLDRFSQDLFGVTNLDDMEDRFVKEVQKVMNTENISIIEIDQDDNIVTKRGNDNQLFKKMTSLELRHHPFCEIINIGDGYFLKIGEYRGKTYLLFIGDKTPLDITPKTVWLKTVTRYVNTQYDSFRVIQDLTTSLEQMDVNRTIPPWLLRMLFNLSEKERKSLSQDLHDGALQEQIVWYRKLEQLSSHDSTPEEIQKQLQQITEGLLDVIHQIRITCNELRPPRLRDTGLISSLEALFEFMQIRTDYSIHFETSYFFEALNDEILIGLYRIVQELLANAAKHSNATQVYISLSTPPGRIELKYQDNGVGMNLDALDSSLNRMGIYGMRERVRSLDGEIDFESAPNQGLAAFISVPANYEKHN
jgi:signal transduction histidine kinase